MRPPKYNPLRMMDKEYAEKYSIKVKEYNEWVRNQVKFTTTEISDMESVIYYQQLLGIWEYNFKFLANADKDTVKSVLESLIIRYNESVKV